MDIIKRIRKIVESTAKNRLNFWGPSAFTYHIINVVKYSKILAKKNKVDVEMVELAALLHDFSSIKEKNLYKNHHIHSANEAEKILTKFGYPAQKIEVIKGAIYSHRASMKLPKKTKVARCLADADSMAHFNEIYELLYMAYVIQKMGVEEGKKFVMEKLERDWKRLSPGAKKLVKNKYEAGRIILK